MVPPLRRAASIAAAQAARDRWHGALPELLWVHPECDESTRRILTLHQYIVKAVLNLYGGGGFPAAVPAIVCLVLRPLCAYLLEISGSEISRQTLPVTLSVTGMLTVCAGAMAAVLAVPP